MKLRKVLQNLAKVIAEETERNPQFDFRIREALGLSEDARAGGISRRKSSTIKHNRAHRRPPSVLDPIELATASEERFRAELTPLNIEQLKDLVADYGMGPGKPVVKWKSPERIIDRIVEISLSRARKGDAFRS